MKKLTFTSLLLLLVAIGYAQSAKLVYAVDLLNSKDDLFRVTLNIPSLSTNNDIFQFASTAPGTYQSMDIGRFVKEFKAFDKRGKELKTEKISDNQYKLIEPKKVRKITYQIAETWDTPVDKNKIYRMCGSSIEDDHVLINGHCVFGYIKEMQGEAIEINLSYPQEWMSGTALSKNEKGNYYADNYDKLVDSPILLGRLSKASTTLSGAPVEIYTYSKADLITSENLLNAMQDMLKAAEAFMIKLPVDRYTFLFHFEDESWGAWEHSYSSEYVMQEKPYTPEYGQEIKNIAAHEFFQVITPLNIHSEIIEHFNFVTPTPSEHLWLYEGTTEWAAHMMQLRNGLISLDELFRELHQKLLTDAYFDKSYSLSKLSLTSFSEEGQEQYGNIYMRGALVAGLLDIRLLELSDGKRGLREVINELSKKYGPKNSFPEKDFFNVFTQMTYPEVADFFNKYIKEANPLPMTEYYAKLGIKYSPEIKTGNSVPTLGIGLMAPDGKVIISSLREELKTTGLMAKDQIIALDGAEVSLANLRETLGVLSQKPTGTAYELTVNRNGEEIKVSCNVLSKEEVNLHVFEVDPNAPEKQVALRKAWMKNL